MANGKWLKRRIDGVHFCWRPLSFSTSLLLICVHSPFLPVRQTQNEKFHIFFRVDCQCSLDCHVHRWLGQWPFPFDSMLAIRLVQWKKKTNKIDMFPCCELSLSSSADKLVEVLLLLRNEQCLNWLEEYETFCTRGLPIHKFWRYKN